LFLLQFYSTLCYKQTTNYELLGPAARWSPAIIIKLQIILNKFNTTRTSCETMSDFIHCIIIKYKQLLTWHQYPRNPSSVAQQSLKVSLFPTGACEMWWSSDVVLPVSEDFLQKNITMMGRSLRQMEIDIKNAQTDKTAPSNDRFVEVMSISFLHTLVKPVMKSWWSLRSLILDQRDPFHSQCHNHEHFQ